MNLFVCLLSCAFVIGAAESAFLSNNVFTTEFIAKIVRTLIDSKDIPLPLEYLHQFNSVSNYEVQFTTKGPKITADFTVKSADKAFDSKCLVCKVVIATDSYMTFYKMHADSVKCEESRENNSHLNALAALSTSDKKASLRAAHDDSLEAFEAHIATHGRAYSGEEEKQLRYAVFQRNMLKAKQLQATEQGTAVYGANQFFDYTESEFRATSLVPDMTPDPSLRHAAIPRGAAPAAFDWRVHGAVTPVKNQGTCGSCWAFSTTGNIEGQWAIKKGKLLSLSEQELLDCDKVDLACNGGLPSQAYKEIERIGGLETEKAYPYDSHKEKCAFKKNAARAYINDSVQISSDEKDMVSWLAAHGPISIGINANAMQWYMGGVSHPWKMFCSPSKLDHGVLIVGYGADGSKPFWVVKNSWGSTWGEKGYYRVFRGAGVCGLNQMCTSAVVD